VHCSVSRLQGEQEKAAQAQLCKHLFTFDNPRSLHQSTRGCKPLSLELTMGVNRQGLGNQYITQFVITHGKRTCPVITATLSISVYAMAKPTTRHN